MFRIGSIKNEDKDEIFVSMGEHHGNDNYYTLITGENGCGKSSLLSKAVNTYIFDNFEKSKESKSSFNSENRPSRVIAICNARFNRFTSLRTYIEQSSWHQPNYYVQNEHNLEVSLSLQSVMHSALREAISKIYGFGEFDISTHSELHDTYTAFEMIGVEPRIVMKLEFNKTYIGIVRRIYQAERNGEEINGRMYNSYRKDHFSWKKQCGVSDALIDDFFDFYKIYEKRSLSLGTIELRLDKAEVSHIQSNMPEYLLLASIAAGFLKPSKFQVQRNGALKWVSTHSLSSGQQSMLMNAVLISTFAKKDALICIDEPENSLHPEWQLNYMSFIKKICSPDIGCHFLIATHSPQIISGMKSDNGCVVKLSKKDSSLNNEVGRYNFAEGLFISNNQELHSISSFIRKSADRQLVDVFKSPGYGNESIIHRLIMILTKLTKKITISEDDKVYVSFIRNFILEGKIDEYDPVVIIYEQIKTIRSVRANDDY